MDGAIRHADRNYFIAVYGAFRRPPDPELRRHFPSRRTGPLTTLFSSSQDLVSLEQWAMDLDYRSEGDSGIKIISEALDQLLPGMKFNRIDKVDRSIMMSTDDGEVPLRQLSEGYQSMAAWAGDLLFQMTETFRDRENPLSARGVLLLDEMDLHLHPVCKRRLVKYLKSAFPNLQIVATTHSPLSVQECGVGELYVVRREDKIPTLIPFVGDPSRMRLAELFLSPLIGLDTLDSPKISKMRERARRIELTPGKRTIGELEELDRLKSELTGTVVLDPRGSAFSTMIRQSKSRSTVPPSHVIRKTEKLFASEASPRTKAASPLAKRAGPARKSAVKKVAAKKAAPKGPVPRKAVAKKMK